jgi:uncharacterized protein
VGFSSAGLVAVPTYGFAVEASWRLETTRYTISPANWPRGLKLSIGVIADVHAGGPAMPLDRIEAIVNDTNALKPDIIVLLGDFAASYKFKTRKIAAEEWSAVLGKLRAPLGVHAVLGNHDWWDDLTAQRNGKGPVIGRRMLEKVGGIPVYENDAVRLSKNGKPFWLAGLGDQLALLDGRRRGLRRFRGVDNLPATLAKVTDDAPIILLAHEPDIFPQVEDPRVAVTLSGHTHGGKVRLLRYSPMVPSRFGNRFAYGHVHENNRHMVVSGGLGCSILPVRIGVPPEIVMVDVAAAGANVAAATSDVAVAA